MLISVRDNEKVRRYVVIAKCCRADYARHHILKTEHFYKTREEAERAKAGIDASGCGHSCIGARGHSIRARWVRNKEQW